MQIFFATAVMQEWQCKTTDIKSAFLQGQNITQDVYLKPPIEERQEGIIQKLIKVIYDLNDAA